MAKRVVVSFRLHSLGDDNHEQNVGVVLTPEEEMECAQKPEGEKRTIAFAAFATAKLLNHISNHALECLAINPVSLPDILVS